MDIIERANERKQIAETILQQLGGRRFILMTGARHLTTLAEPESGLSFRLPLHSKGPNYWRIKLNGRDTYDIETFYVRNHTSTPLKTFTDIYNDGLVELFERETGLHTTL